MMAKDKSLKSKSKKNKLTSNDIRDVAEEQVETKIKKKRKHVEAEALVQIHPVTNSPNDIKCKKDKKCKKKKMSQETHTKQTENPDPSSCSEEMHEKEGRGDNEQDLSPEELRVLERKLKKIRKKEEKKRLREEGLTLPKKQAVGPSASEQALDYLTCWAENRSAWKFQKTRQTWLLQHMFDSEKVSDDKFSVMLQYLEGLCGQAKDTTVQKAVSVVEDSGQATEDTEVQQRAQRAREVIQLLS
ncbi:uncharacterized protein C7orf50 isoform X2 [Nematolebias whitei]|uniref:uncharacterized protein C7orf50 isoform X2 n=1 Tax=Nematolebias whitei TaxID=451745 RepID=UPI00189B2DB6|nr:uncharacterized protein C7orf50 isoform X2 [Nematolebias whitei]